MTRSGLQLGLVRYWMGTGESGNYPGGIKTIFRIFTRAERTLAIGIFNTGSMVGATIAPPLVVYLAQRYGFRSAFLVPAALGLFWVPLWVVNVRSTESRQRVRAQAVPLRRLLGSSSAWAVMLCRFFIGPVMQFYWYWIPSYLYEARHLSLTQVGFLGWIPFLLEMRAVSWAAGAPVGCSAAASAPIMCAASRCFQVLRFAWSVWRCPFCAALRLRFSRLAWPCWPTISFPLTCLAPSLIYLPITPSAELQD